MNLDSAPKIQIPDPSQSEVEIKPLRDQRWFAKWLATSAGERLSMCITALCVYRPFSCEASSDLWRCLRESQASHKVIAYSGEWSGAMLWPLMAFADVTVRQLPDGLVLMVDSFVEDLCGGILVSRADVNVDWLEVSRGISKDLDDNFPFLRVFAVRECQRQTEAALDYLEGLAANKRSGSAPDLKQGEVQ